MTTFRNPADLYSDVAARGSLAAALQALAAEHGLAIGEVITNEKQPLHYANITSVTQHRGSLGVFAGVAERCWVINGWGQGIPLAGGKTEDLTDVVRAAHLWRDGARLRDIQRLVPLVELGRLAEAAEQGPDHVVATKWQHLRQAARQADWPEQQTLIDTAYAEPKMRQLYPYTSHWSLRFSTTTGYPFSPDVVCLEAPRGSGEFVVRATWNGTILGQTATAGEAIALATSHLPADLQPATAGPYPEQDTPTPPDRGPTS